VTHPLEEAARLRELAAEKFKKYEGQSVGIIFGANPVLYAVLQQAEADALERGYLRGRAMAAYEVRMGLDQNHVNGGIHFDSDTEPPPQWLVGTAEKLARGIVS
jgi:hypothetical protein